MELQTVKSGVFTRRACRAIAISFGLLPAIASAATCEQSVTKSGTFVGGQRYEVQADIPHLGVAAAFQQLRAVYQISKIRILAEDRARGTMAAELGATLLEQAIPITISAQNKPNSSILKMVYDVRPGEVVGGGWVRRHMCSVLTQIRAGASLAQTSEPQSSLAPRLAVPTRPDDEANNATPIETSALAGQVLRAQSNPARIDASFVGRLYRVTGMVSNITIRSGGYAVWFEGEPPKGSEEEQWQHPSLAVICLVPRTNPQAAAALSIRSQGTLTGRFAKLDHDPRAPAIILEDCRTP
jgi:hypothetical protein